MDSFDRVEGLARCMCESAGRDWHSKGAHRDYWRQRAGKALELPGAHDAPDWARTLCAIGWALALVEAVALVWP